MQTRAPCSPSLPLSIARKKSDDVEQNIYGIWWERRQRKDFRKTYTGSPLFHNLQWFQPLLCQDPRDRVYAILAISNDSERLGLKPDYSPCNTVNKLSRELSVRVLENATNLQLLNFACLWRQTHSSLPSWCLTLDRESITNTPETIAYDIYSPHPFSNDSLLTTFQANNSVLVIKGQVLDYVPFPISVTALSGQLKDASHMEFFSAVLQLIPDEPSIADITTLLLTITGRASWSPSRGAYRSTSENIAFYFWAYIRHMLRLTTKLTEGTEKSLGVLLYRCRCVIEKLRAFAPQIPAHELLSVDDTIGGEEYTAIERVLQYALDERRFIGRTQAGRLYNSMYSLHEGNAIVVFRGSDRLFTIRTGGGTTYKLIGDIFVDGFMHGEAYSNKNPDEVDYNIYLN